MNTLATPTSTRTTKDFFATAPPCASLPDFNPVVVFLTSVSILIVPTPISIVRAIFRARSIVVVVVVRGRRRGRPSVFYSVGWLDKTFPPKPKPLQAHCEPALEDGVVAPQNQFNVRSSWEKRTKLKSLHTDVMSS